MNIAFIHPDLCASQLFSLFESLSIVSWIILGSVSWIVAYGIQGVGEFCKGIRHFGKWIPDDQAWYRKLIRFDEVATPGEKNVFERFVIIKESCGNTAISFIMYAAILTIFWNSRLKNIGLLLSLLIGGIILLSMHKVHARRNTWWLEGVLDFRGEPDKGLPCKSASENTDGTER